jgi:hypothetical protein
MKADPSGAGELDRVTLVEDEISSHLAQEGIRVGQPSGGFSRVWIIHRIEVLLSDSDNSS